MSIATEISRLTTAKADIKSAIIAKGVSVPTDAKLDTYDTYVAQISGGGGGGWTPPADWIDISSVNDNEINLLTSDGGVGVAFRITVASSGTYSIDWGDGTIETARASGTIYQHQYTIGSGQSVNDGQYTCFAIRIYNATNTITRYETQRVSGYSRVQYSPLLWAVFGTQGITSYANAFYVSGTGVQCRELVACAIPSFASCTNTSYMLQNCYSLSSLTLPTSWGSVTNVSYMLQNCYSLSSLTLPTSWGSVTNVSNMLFNCYSLSSLTLPISWGSVTNVFYMLYNCYSLSSLTLPTSWGSVTTTNNMLQGCYSLSSLTLPTSWGSVTDMGYMLQNCYSLRILNGIEYLGAQTVQSDFTDILRDVQALTGTITINSLLSKIGIYGASSHKLLCTGIRLTNSGSLFAGSSPQVDVSYTNLDATALNQLFTDLPTLSGKTINITGSTGAGTCNRTIASAKGWTVV